MATPRDEWIKIADLAKDITLPTQLDVRPFRLTIRTRIWPSGVIGEGDPVDSDLVLPQKFKIRSLKAAEVVGTGGRYELADIVVSGISKRPSDDPTVGYTADQLAPPVSGSNVEILYMISGENAGIYNRVDLDSDKLLSHKLVLRRLTGNYYSDNVIRVYGSSTAEVIQE